MNIVRIRRHNKINTTFSPWYYIFSLLFLLLVINCASAHEISPSGGKNSADMRRLVLNDFIFFAERPGNYSIDLHFFVSEADLSGTEFIKEYKRVLDKIFDAPKGKISIYNLRTNKLHQEIVILDEVKKVYDFKIISGEVVMSASYPSVLISIPGRYAVCLEIFSNEPGFSDYIFSIERLHGYK